MIKKENGVTKYYVGPIEDGTWQPNLSRALDQADTFRVMMSDGEGPLSRGREQFLTLPDITVERSSRMRDAIVFSGKFTHQSRDLITLPETSLIEYDAQTKLWDYQLLSNGVEILSVGDFTDLVLEATAQDMTDLASAGVQTNGWSRIVESTP